MLVTMQQHPSHFDFLQRSPGCWLCSRFGEGGRGRDNTRNKTKTDDELRLKGVNYPPKDVTQAQQQRPESPAVTRTWHACFERELTPLFVDSIPHECSRPRSVSDLKLPGLLNHSNNFYFK